VKILLAIDGSEPSSAAVRAVARRPWPRGAIVRVLSVAQPLLPPGELRFAATATAYGQMREMLTVEARSVVANAVDPLERKGLAVETVVREGDPRTEVVAEAKRWGADLVVVGSRGWTGVKRWLMGSVAEYVVRHAPCSVEVARTTSRKAAA
jgi:nucleotide-binding universal stress UspA family protein